MKNENAYLLGQLLGRVLIGLVFLAFAGILTLALGGCTSETEYGKCIGLTETGNPALLYKPSVNNIVIGIVFSQTIIVPVEVIVDQFSCPVGRK